MSQTQTHDCPTGFCPACSPEVYTDPVPSSAPPATLGASSTVPPPPGPRARTLSQTHADRILLSISKLTYDDQAAILAQATLRLNQRIAAQAALGAAGVL